MSYPASKHSHFDLVPGHQNTTTKEPMLRPPDMRLVTALASKGTSLTSTLREMNMGPSGRATALQQLTTRDVVMIPDLFEPSSGFVMPKDPWESGSKKVSKRMLRYVAFLFLYVCVLMQRHGYPSTQLNWLDFLFYTWAFSLFIEELYQWDLDARRGEPHPVDVTTTPSGGTQVPRDPHSTAPSLCM